MLVADRLSCSTVGDGANVFRLEEEPHANEERAIVRRLLIRVFG